MEHQENREDDAQLPEVFSEAQERRIIELIRQELILEHQKSYSWPAKENA